MQNLNAQKTPEQNQSLHSNNTPDSVRGAFDEIRITMRSAIRNSNGNVRMNLRVDSTRGTSLELIRFGAITGGVNAYFDDQKGIFVIGGDIDTIPLATAQLLRECVATANAKIQSVDVRKNATASNVISVLESIDPQEIVADGTGLRPTVPTENPPRFIQETAASF